MNEHSEMEREREREGWGKIHGLQRNRKNEEQTVKEEN